MNKREERNLKAIFIMTIGLFSALHLNSKWGFGWILSLALGTIFAIALWVGVHGSWKKLLSNKNC